MIATAGTVVVSSALKIPHNWQRDGFRRSSAFSSRSRSVTKILAVRRRLLLQTGISFAMQQWSKMRTLDELSFEKLAVEGDSQPALRLSTVADRLGWDDQL